MKRKGMFITFEGTEGCGKTTQVRLLAAQLRKRGRKVLLTHEPGGTPLGKSIRRILIHSKKNMSPEAEALLFMASRAELVRRVIRPALLRGKVVVCDRWIDATYAYQGFGLGVLPEWIEAVGWGAVEGLEPDLTLLLDLDVGTGLRRAHGRIGHFDRIEKRSMEFHRRVRRGYLALARKHRRFRRVRVDGIEKTHEKILGIVERVLR